VTYFAALREAGHRTLGADAVWAATEFAFFELVLKRCHSVFLPLPDTVGTAAFWTQAIHNLQAYSPEEDQLFRNFRAMLDRGSPFLVNIDLAGEYDPAPMPARDRVMSDLHSIALTAIRALEDDIVATRAHARDSEATARAALTRLDRVVSHYLATGQEVLFRAGSAFNWLLASGWSEPGEGGVWSEGTRAVLRIPAAHTGSQPAMLVMDVTAFVHPASPVREVTLHVNGQHCGSHRFTLDAPSLAWQAPCPREAVGALEIEFIIPAPERPSAIDPDTGDGRALGISIRSGRLAFGATDSVSSGASAR
jgi:hypothetical protein